MNQNIIGRKVIIIGAGVGGLATANLLAKAGYQVSVYEQSPAPGGRAGILVKDGFVFDTGPSWLLMKDVFAHYYELLDTTLSDQLDLTRLDPAYKVFFDHKPPVVITSNLAVDADTFEAIEPGSGVRLKRYVADSYNNYQLSLKHFLYTNFVQKSQLMHQDVRRNLGTLSTLLLTTIHSHVQKQFKDLRLQQVMEYQMVFLGVSPFKAPALYSLMSALDFREGVYYPKGGIYKIVESLTTVGAKLGVSHHYNASVTKITTSGGVATGINLTQGQHVDADIVISNADLQYTETALLDPSDQTFPTTYWNRKTASPSALLVYLGIDGSIPEFEHHNLLFVESWRRNFEDIGAKIMPEKASVYICKSSATDPTVAPSGTENVFVLIPIPAGVDLTTTEQSEYVDKYLEQIRSTTGVDLAGRAISRTVRGPDYFGSDLHSWKNTMLGPSHILNQSAMFRTNNRSRKLSNLYYVGASTRPGIGLPMCLISAELIYKHLLGDTSAEPIAEIRSKS